MLLVLLALGCIETQVSSTEEREPEPPEPIDPTLHDADFDGYVDASDCRPYNPDFHPGADELCDGIDNDCDEEIDEDDYDADDDGFDDYRDCALLDGLFDCNDNDPNTYPGALEICDYLDQDCNGVIDDGDYDGDGEDLCTDCDDADAFVFTGAAEACDAVDNDCDGEIDELWDFDGDGYSECQGDCENDDDEIGPHMRDDCDGVDNDCDGTVDEDDDRDGDGVATCEGDCDDTDAANFPGNTEVCDGQDNDCDATTSEYDDNDGDGFTICTADCDDGSAAAYPGGTEACDSVDNDCNGYTDEMAECYGCTVSGSYWLCSTTTTGELARTSCEAFGGYLALVSSSAENDDIANLAVRATWIGANDVDVEGSYMWPDGTSVGYDSWASAEPTGSESADCVITNYNGRRGDWSDESCSSSYQFVCEF